MELTDGHVVLRTPVERDATMVVDGVQSSLDTLLPWMPWAGVDYDEDSALEWIRGEIEPGGHPFLILDPDGRIVGAIGLNGLDERNDIANLGYWLRSDATGAGLATRATRLVARHAIDDLGLHRIEITMSVENERSRAVAERAGAIYEGVLRGRLRYGDRHHDAHVFCFLADAELP